MTRPATPPRPPVRPSVCAPPRSAAGHGVGLGVHLCAQGHDDPGEGPTVERTPDLIAEAATVPAGDAAARSAPVPSLDPAPSPAPAPHSAGSAGAWRQRLRREAGEHARWRCLADAADALRAHPDAQRAAEAVLDQALALLSARDGAVLALRGDRWRVLAGRGRALPPGASLPGAWPGVAEQVERARGARGADWWLGASPVPVTLEAAIPGTGGTLGLISVALPAGLRPEPEDRATLAALAAMLGAVVAEVAPRGARRGRAGAEDARLAALTRRERQVLSLLPRGLTNAELGAELGIAPGTVKAHVERILHKLRLGDRTQAAVYATRQGLAA